MIYAIWCNMTSGLNLLFHMYLSITIVIIIRLNLWRYNFLTIIFIHVILLLHSVCIYHIAYMLNITLVKFDRLTRLKLWLLCITLFDRRHWFNRLNVDCLFIIIVSWLLWAIINHFVSRCHRSASFFYWCAGRLINDL